MSDSYEIAEVFDDIYGTTALPWTMQPQPEARTKQFADDAVPASAFKLARWKSAARRRRSKSTMLGDLTGLRIDDADEYAAFRAEKRAGHVQMLKERLAALEAAFAGHVSDGHGGHVSIDVLGDAVVEAAQQAKAGGRVVPLAKKFEGKVECWVDGGELCCTIKMLDDAGSTKYATGMMPVKVCVDDVMAAAMDADVEIEDLMSHGTSMVHVIGGESLLAQVCGFAPALMVGVSSTITSRYLHGCDVLIAVHGRN